MGVWIEINLTKYKKFDDVVTPCVGVWIEILNIISNASFKTSLPAWECGLKYNLKFDGSFIIGHSLRGSVD